MEECIMYTEMTFSSSPDYYQHMLMSEDDSAGIIMEL